MFRLIALVGLFVSVSAQAGYPTEEDGWDTIKGDHRVVVEAPQMTFGGHFVSVFNVCQDGEKFRTMYKVESCAEWGPRKCNRWEENYRFKSMTGTRKICVDEGRAKCRKWEEEEYTLPTTYGANIYIAPHGGRKDYGRFLFSKGVHVGGCGEN